MPPAAFTVDDLNTHKRDVADKGFTIINDVYNSSEVEQLLTLIAGSQANDDTFRKSNDLFAIRQFSKGVPDAFSVIFNQRLKNLISQLFGDSYFVVKSIYFDKPGGSNWFVAWHQDLTISVDNKTEMPGYGPWTVKQNQFAVQPPVAILENNFTVRIHLNDADETNGALKVLPGSHANGVVRTNDIDFNKQPAVSCNVKAGGIMVMRPLLLHASARATGNKSRKVIHIEFSDATLPTGLNWAEKQYYND